MAMQQPTRRDIQKAKPSSSTSSTTGILIPDKLYFRIGEVARLCALPAYVLRFWETEFPQLKPNKGGTGQRLYRKRDVELAMEIKRLLYDQKFTIPGARHILQQKRRSPGESQNELPFRSPQAHTASAPQAASPSQSASARLTQLRAELQEILGMLGGTLTPKQKSLTPVRRTLRTSAGNHSSHQHGASAETDSSAPLLF